MSFGVPKSYAVVVASVIDCVAEAISFAPARSHLIVLLMPAPQVLFRRILYAARLWTRPSARSHAVYSTWPFAARVYGLTTTARFATRRITYASRKSPYAIQNVSPAEDSVGIASSMTTGRSSSIRAGRP